jgi:membrane protease YdiL (CAAX protease family)
MFSQVYDFVRVSSVDIIILVAFLLLVIGTMGAWVYVVRWSRQPKRPVRAWTLNWSIAGLTMLLLSVGMSLSGALWSQPHAVDSLGLLGDVGRSMDAARACLLIPGVILGVLGLASLGIARRPEGRRFTVRELGAAAIFIFGLMIAGEGVAFVTSRSILSTELSANSALDRLLPGLAIMLAGAGVWYWQAFRQDQPKHIGVPVTEWPPPWNIATAVGLIVGYFAIMYVIAAVTVVIVFLFIPTQDQEVLAEWTVRGTFTGVTNGLGALAMLGVVYAVVKFLSRGKGEPWALLGWRRVSFDWLISASLGAAALMVLFELSAASFKVLPVPKIYLKMFHSPADWIVMIPFLLLIAPLAEEVLHRGVFYPAVAGRYGLRTGVIVTSLVYGGMYVITYASDWAALARALVMGTLYTLLRARSRSIWPSVLAFTLMDAYLIARTALLLK